MRDPSESRPSSRCRLLFFQLILAFLCVAAIAQKDPKSNLPKYDLHTEIKIKATVEEVKLPPKGSEKEAAHLLVKTGTDTLDVYLCPKSFLVDMGVSFNKGDEIALTGSKIKLGEADLVLAREIVKGSDTLVLRDDKAIPSGLGIVNRSRLMSRLTISNFESCAGADSSVVKKWHPLGLSLNFLGIGNL